MNNSTKFQLDPNKDFVRFKLLLVTFLFVTSVILTYYNKCILDSEISNKKQNRMTLSQLIESVIDNFHCAIEKEAKLIEVLLDQYNSECQKIKHLENVLENGYFTLIKKNQSRLIGLNASSNIDLDAVNDFMANNISREFNLLSYHIKINNGNCQLSHVLYNIPIGKLIKNLESILANIKSPSTFFILDEYYNEIYRFGYSQVKREEQFCTKIISPFPQEFYLCEADNGSIYGRLIFVLLLLTFVVTIILAFMLASIKGMEKSFAKTKTKSCSDQDECTQKCGNKESDKKLDFLSRVTHELRTPLNIIITFSEMIKDEHLGPINNKKYISYSREIYNYSNSLLLTIDNMIDSTKSKYCTISARKKLLSLSDVLSDILNTFSHWIGEKKIKLKRDIDDNIPKILADQNQIKRAIMNVVSNAIKFNSIGGSINIGLSFRDKVITLIVEDTGVGIDESSMNNILDDLSEIKESLSRKFDGIGIGLSLSRNLVELNNGKLKIASKENYGTTVSITFDMSEQHILKTAS